MARSVQHQSIAGATTTGAGSAVETKGHITLGLMVVTTNADTANDTVDARLEVRGPSGEWAVLRDETGTAVGQVTVTELDDIDGDGTTHTAYVTVHGVAAPQVRANLTAITDAASSDLAVDAYVFATNNGGAGRSYRDV